MPTGDDAFLMQRGLMSPRTRMKSLLLMCFALVATAACWAAAGDGDWLEIRHDGTLTAIQPLPGEMRQAPEVIARLDLGRSQPSVKPVELPDGTCLGLTLFSGVLSCYEESGELRWKSHPAGINYSAIVSVEDINEDGKTEVFLSAARPVEPYGAVIMARLEDGAVIWRYDVEPMSYWWQPFVENYLHEKTSKQILVVTHGYPPDEKNGYMAMFDFDSAGLPTLKWRYDFHQYTCYPTVLTTDLDGDGIKEIAVESHSRMWFVDVRNGELKDFVAWDVSPANPRSYGYVRFADLDKDGLEDFLCIGDFAQHHEVLLNRNGKLSLVWHYGWPESVTTGKVATRYPSPPYADIDGDGRFEVVVSMFNSEDERAWLVRAYDAITGALKYRYPDVIVRCCVDMDGDGVSELLGETCHDPTGIQLVGVQLLRVVNGEMKSIWTDAESVSAPTPKHFRPVDSNSDEPFQQSDHTQPAFVKRAGQLFQLMENGNKKFVLRAVKEVQEVPKGDFSKVPLSVGPPFPSLFAANITGDKANELILYSNETARVLELRHQELVATAEYKSTCEPAFVDLDGNEYVDVVLANISPERAPRFKALSPAKGDAVLWETELPQVDRVGLPQPRKAYLRAGRFTGKDISDIYFWVGTPIVRSGCLEGRTGKLLWEKGEMPQIERYWGPSTNFASVYDFNGDGKDDLVFTNPDYYCVADGMTGDLLLGPLFPPNIFHQPSQGLYTFPVILSRGSSTPLVGLVGGHYFQGVMTLAGEPLWYKLPKVGESRSKNEGFLYSPEGMWLMGFGKQNGLFVCVSVDDGKERWSIPVEAACSDVVTADLDGDGTFEFLFGTSHGSLFAVGDSEMKPRVIWNVSFPASVGTPMPADLNGDGKIEITCVTSDGYVWVLGSPDVDKQLPKTDLPPR